MALLGGKQVRHPGRAQPAAKFVLMTALSVSAGRFVEDKPSYAVISRYLTLSSWLWASTVALLPFVNGIERFKRWLYLSLPACLIALMLGGGWVGYENRYLPIASIYEALRDRQDVGDQELAKLHPNTTRTKPLLKQLREQGLSLYAKP